LGLRLDYNPVISSDEGAGRVVLPMVAVLAWYFAAVSRSQDLSESVSVILIVRDVIAHTDFASPYYGSLFAFEGSFTGRCLQKLDKTVGLLD
jgi:hypothetical protein